MTRRGQAGFTLVELLIAMTLIGMISVLLFGGLRFGARSWDAVVSTAAERDRIASTQLFLRERLATVATTGRARRRRAETPPRIIGTSGQIGFRAPWLTALSLGGEYDFALSLDDTGPGELILSWAPAADDEDTPLPADDLSGTRTLLSGVENFVISYYGQPVGTTDPDWSSTWDDTEIAPLLVRIEVEFTDPARLWPDFVVRVRG